MRASSRVPAHYHDTPILEYLRRRFTYASAERWRMRIAEQAVLCNDSVCTLSTVVKNGDRVTCIIPDWDEPPADLSYTIVYEDQWLLAVDKPGNLLVHRSGKSYRSNLIYHLRYVHEPSYPDAHVVNRLDRETSGLVLIAKDRAILPALHESFAAQRVHKRYRAIVHGTPAPGEGEICAPIGKDPRSPVSYRHWVDTPGAKPSSTRYAVERRLGDRFALVSLWPRTGRTHQIRVHLAAKGHVIAGDKLYSLDGGEYLRWREHPERFADRWPFHRQALHCAEVTVFHPALRRDISLEAPMPTDMRLFLESAERNEILDSISSNESL
jgi:23S rRNA pseudouridine1911/1915/1917 synthase